MSPGGAYLGIDAGGSSTRWVLRGPTGELGRGRTGPLSGLSFLAGASEGASARERIAQLAAAVRAADGRPEGEARAPDAVVAGVTGLSTGDAVAEAVGRALAEALGLQSSRVRVVDDTMLAYRSAFEPGEGVVVYAGTGSIAIHVPERGPAVRAGGHGYLIDDAGGGFWIGRRALRSVLRQADRRGRPAEGPLAEAVYAALGAREWPTIRSRIYGGGREAVAALVPAVREALAAGDADAAAITAEAGTELANLAEAVMVRLGRPLPVALVGGVSALGDPLRRAVAGRLPAASDLRDAARSPVEAAALWAQRDEDARSRTAG